MKEKTSSWIDDMYHIGIPCTSMNGTYFTVSSFLITSLGLFSLFPHLSVTTRPYKIAKM